MTNEPQSRSIAFTENARASFHEYILRSPSSRRLSRAEQDSIIKWLVDPNRRPSSQKEFSRRNYIRRTFAWDDNTKTLLAVATNKGEKSRPVVTEDRIAEVVEQAHNNIGHLGWDATWKTISDSYYGILRADVIFLLKQCQICASNPRKRPKGPSDTVQYSELFENCSENPSNFEELFPLLEVNHDESAS